MLAKRRVHRDTAREAKKSSTPHRGVVRAKRCNTRFLEGPGKSSFLRCAVNGIRVCKRCARHPGESALEMAGWVQLWTCGVACGSHKKNICVATASPSGDLWIADIVQKINSHN